MSTPPSIAKAAQRLRILKDKKEDLETQLKAVNKEARYLQEVTLPKLLEDAELEKATIDGAGTVYIKQELYVSMSKDEDSSEAPFYDWARTHAPDLVVEFIHPARLKAFCKESLENGVALPDNMIKTSFIPTATLLRK